MRVILQLIICWTIVSGARSQGSRYIPFDGGEIHYQIIGEGETVLIINGGPGFSSEGFACIAGEIAALGYRTVLFDQRGTGRSTLDVIDSTTVTMDLMARDIEHIRKDLGMEEWVLFGHSFGGMLANYYTSKYPERVKAIIHSSSGGVDLQLREGARGNLYSRLTEEEVDSLNYWRGQLGEAATVLNRRNYNRFLASAYVYNKEHVPAINERLMQGDLSLNRMVWDDMFRIGFDCKEALRSFDKPVLILQGKQDVIPADLGHLADSVFYQCQSIFS